jgi:hypothetical protein
MTPDESSPSEPGGYTFMSAAQYCEVDTSAGKPSLTPLLRGSALLSLGDASVLFLVSRPEMQANFVPVH